MKIIKQDLPYETKTSKMIQTVEIQFDSLRLEKRNLSLQPSQRYHYDASFQKKKLKKKEF